MIGRSTRSLLVLLGLLIFIVGVIVLNFITYSQYVDREVVLERIDESVSLLPRTNTPRESNDDYKSKTKPARLPRNNSKTTIPKIPIHVYNISFDGEEDKTILVREAGRGNYHVLLLHTQEFSSRLWQRIGTLQYLSKWGYRAFAVDIPRGTDGQFAMNGDDEAVQWLTKLIRTLHLSNLVIVSPSTSGQLTLPYIFQLKNEQKLIRGFVAIAPHGADRFPNYNYRQVRIPTLVVHAEKDSKYQPTYELLLQIPTSEVLFIIDASHASYADKPTDFHNGLRQFLYDVYRPIYIKYLLSNETKLKTKRPVPES